MPAPEPMLGVSTRRWPDGARWMLQPKWDGFRHLIGVRTGGDVRGWSRHGVDLTARLGSLLGPFADVPSGTTFDGELVVVTERDGKPAQDFVAVTRAVFTGLPDATEQLRFVAFASSPWRAKMLDLALGKTGMSACARRFRFASGPGWPRRSPRRSRRTMRLSPWGSRARC